MSPRTYLLTPPYPCFSLKNPLIESRTTHSEDRSPKGSVENTKMALQDALDSVRLPLLFNPVEPYTFDGTSVGADSPSESFNSAVTMVIAALERGFCSNRDPAPLGPSDWAKLSCAMMAAVGRGYYRQYTPDQEAKLDKLRAETVDPQPLSRAYPTFFHRLGATAEEVAFQLEVDSREGREGYQDWYSTLKNNFNKKATKAAAAEVDEKWMAWKAYEFDRLAAAHQNELGNKARKRDIGYFTDMAERLGLQVTQEGTPLNQTPAPTTGRKRTSSGSAPSPVTPVPTTPKATRINPPRAAKRASSTSPAPRGRESTPIPQPAPRLDPSSTPRPAKKTPIPPFTFRMNTEDGGPKQTPPPKSGSTTPGKTEAEALTASVLTKILARLEALEKRSMPPPAKKPEGQIRPNPAPTAPSEVPSSNRNSTGQPLHAPRLTEEGDFTPVTRKGKKGKDKASPPQVNLTPASYANAAATATNTKQPTPARPITHPPAITEITVLRSSSGGHVDSQIELSIRARAADAIVREVRQKMKNAVANPISLRAGRWSAHQRSKGNFVYSFDGNVPFDLIRSYEKILLAPFHDTGKLSPSMGWTRFLAHGVPVFGEHYIVTGPGELLKEVSLMPGLKKAHFAMPPRWLKPVDRIRGDYSSITFAISDPDGSISDTLLKSRAALFGKEVEIQRWVDKPALVQCSRCHALGHIKTSRACPLGKDSVRCYICGGAHQSEKHDQVCPRKHAVAGICDCKHFKCINCHKTGHHCRNTLCPARDLFRPRKSKNRKSKRPTGKDREWALAEERDATSPNHAGEAPFDVDEDLYSPANLPPNPTTRQMRTALHHRSIDNICKNLASYPLTDENGASGSGTSFDYDPDMFPEAINQIDSMDTDAAGLTDYSPSRLQGDAAMPYLA